MISIACGNPACKTQSQLVVLVLFDSLRPSQHFFIHVGTGLAGFNQY